MPAGNRHQPVSAAFAARAALVLCAAAICFLLFGAEGAGADIRVDCDAGQNLQHAINGLPEISSHNLGVLYVSGTCRGNFKVYNRRSFTIRGVTKNGRMAVLDGEHKGRVLEINNCCGGSMALDNLEIRNGKGEGNGGAGILIHGMDVTIDHLKIVHNKGPHWGGGILSGNFLKISHSYIGSNSAEMGGGIFIYHNGANISDTTIAFNHADSHAGAVYSSGDQWSVELVRSIVANNTSNGSTPGVIAQFVTIKHSAVIHNKAKAHAHGAVSGGTQILVTDSSIIGNDGGAQSIAGGLMAGYVSLSNSTVADNTGATVGGVYAQSLGATATTFTGNRGTSTEGAGAAGAIYAAGNPPNLKASIIAGNSGVNPDCFSHLPVVSHGYNLVGNAKGCNWSYPATGDRIGKPGALIDARLGAPIYQEFGPASVYPVVPLLAGSPAIDAIPPAACPVHKDQRGQPRPSGAGCDIGSYEVQAGH
jgi:hypothetical protein